VSTPEIDGYVALIRHESMVVDDPVASSEPLAADPDDEYLIDLARATRVDSFASGDTACSPCGAWCR
jgi:hypothetical protein